MCLRTQACRYLFFSSSVVLKMVAGHADDRQVTYTDLHPQPGRMLSVYNSRVSRCLFYVVSIVQWVYMCVCAYAHPRRGRRLTSGAFCCFLPYFSETGSWTHNAPLWLVWLACTLQRSPCLCTPSLGLQEHTTMSGFYPGMPGIQTQACVANTVHTNAVVALSLWLLGPGISFCLIEPL